MNESYEPGLCEHFLETCRRYFRFLEEEYGCTILGTDNEYPYRLAVTYGNATTAVDIRYDRWEDDIFILLIRLVDGAVPENLPGNHIHRHPLDAVLHLRAPDEIVRQDQYSDPLKSEDREDILRQYASALRTHASDILRGDFSFFPELVRSGEGAMRESEEQYRNVFGQLGNTN